MQKTKTFGSETLICPLLITRKTQNYSPNAESYNKPEISFSKRLKVAKLQLDTHEGLAKEGCDGEMED
jgi:hypothetical protein